MWQKHQKIFTFLTKFLTKQATSQKERKKTFWQKRWWNAENKLKNLFDAEAHRMPIEQTDNR